MLVRLGLLAVFLVPAFSGCAKPESDQLTETWIVSVRSDGPFEVAFPVALHDDGPDIAAWAALFDPDVGHGTLRQEGGSLVLNGSGFVAMEAHFRREADHRLDAFMQGTWSDGQGTAVAGDRGIAVELRSGGPVETMSLRQEATSKHCFLERNHFAALDAPGVHLFPGHATGECR